MTTPGSQDPARAALPRAPRFYWCLWLVVALALCAPVWLPAIPPLSDYYNHLARLHIMSHHDAVAQYRQFYVIDWAPNPNLALELVGLPLMAVFSIAITAKLFLTLTLLLWHLGCTLLARAVHGRLTSRALVCSFFVYNQQLFHGYVSFVFSMGLCLMTLAFWLESRRRWSAWRVGLAIIAGTEVYLAHLSGFATLAVSVAIMTAHEAARAGGSARGVVRAIDRQMLAGLVLVVPGTVLFVAGFLTATGGGGAIAFAPLTYNLRDALTVMTGYSEAMDAMSMVVFVGLVLLVLATGTRGRAGHGLVLAGAGLAVLYWVCPSDVATGLEVNVRFALGAFTLVALGIGISVPARVRAVVLGIALALMTTRTAVTAAAWMELDAELAAHVEAFEAIGPGASVHTIFFYPAPAVMNADRVRGLALIHSVSLAAVYRQAHVPTLYAIRGQQPLVHRKPLYSAHRFARGTRPEIAWDEIARSYDYVWVCHAPAGLVAPLRVRGRVVARAPGCALYRL